MFSKFSSEAGSAHLELDLILSVLKLALQIAAVDDVGDGIADVGTGGVVVIVLLNNGNISAHVDDVAVDCLAAEVGNAFLVNFGLAGTDAAGDDAAVTQGVVIGLHGALAAAEGVGEEVASQVNILAVAGDVQGGAAVGRIAVLAAVLGAKFFVRVGYATFATFAIPLAAGFAAMAAAAFWRGRREKEA